MSLLKKIGQILGAVGGQIPIVAGIISAVIPQSKTGQTLKVAATVENELAVIGGIIASVEAASEAIRIKTGTALTGEQKFAAALPQVEKVLASTALALNHGVQDPALHAKAVSEITQGAVDYYNSFKSDNVQTQNG